MRSGTIISNRADFRASRRGTERRSSIIRHAVFRAKSRRCRADGEDGTLALEGPLGQDAQGRIAEGRLSSRLADRPRDWNDRVSVALRAKKPGRLRRNAVTGRPLWRSRLGEADASRAEVRVRGPSRGPAEQVQEQAAPLVPSLRRMPVPGGVSSRPSATPPRGPAGGRLRASDRCQLVERGPVRLQGRDDPSP